MGKLSNADLSDIRRGYPITEQAVYLDHAAVGPISRGVVAAMQDQANLHCENLTGTAPIYRAQYAETRAATARLVGATSDRVAFIQNTSHGMSLIANGQPWQAGDNVIVPAMEFPSNFLPWKRLENLGVELRLLDAPDGRVTPGNLAKVIDAKTRIVALSAVQYYNGYRVDLAGISEVAQKAGAMTVVDGTQAVGALQIDMAATGVDALVVSAHKWMLGPLGIGFMALSDRMLAQTEVTQLGWLSVNEPFAFRREIDLPQGADRFEPGTENAAGLFGLRARLAEIDTFGIAQIEARLLDLTADLASKARSLGFEITSPMGAAERSSTLTFRRDGICSDTAVAALRDAGIFLSARHGNLRASPHYYNSAEEISALTDWLGTHLD